MARTTENWALLEPITMPMITAKLVAKSPSNPTITVALDRIVGHHSYRSTANTLGLGHVTGKLVIAGR